MRYRRGEIGLAVDRGDALELGRKGLQSLLVNRRLVHARSVIIADLAAGLRLDALARGRLFENRGEDRGDVLVESAVTPPARLVRRDRVGLEPRAAGVSVEIGAGLDAVVDRRWVE